MSVAACAPDSILPLSRDRSAMAASFSSSSATASLSLSLPAFLQQSKADIHNKFVDLEWQQRHRLLEGTQASNPPSPWARMTGAAITARNRYVNVEPFAQNRIKLQVSEGVSDYINASPIVVGRRRYIATQGPKNTGVNHFYRMLAAEVASPAVVVMLTQTHEAGREKCFQYYPLTAAESPLVIPPDPEASDGFRGEVTLEKVEEHAASRCQIRTLRLRVQTDSGPPMEKEIVHLLFVGWPDFLVPEGDDRTALLELVQHSATLNRTSPDFSLPVSSATTTTTSTAPAQLLNGTANPADGADNPRIIHCSAGVGRSGTFIALDALLAALHAGDLDAVDLGRDPVADLVDLLRQQRMMMVQAEAQFNFLYDVLREQMAKRLAGRAAS